MDNKTPDREEPGEVTLESLIAISSSIPEKGIVSKLSSDDLKCEKLDEGIYCDAAEEYRNALISISYSHSPDGEGLPSTSNGLKN